jgi:DNA-binding NarL/FixJ family response regulator
MYCDARMEESMNRPGKNITVLVADFHGDIRDAVCEYLNRIDGVHVVAEALNGFEVIAKVERLKPDIVLLDVGLPELNGIETARIIKRKFASTKVYLATLFDETLYEMEAHRVAADGIISKTDLKRGLSALMRYAQHQATQ